MTSTTSYVRSIQDDRKQGVYRCLKDFCVGFWNETVNWGTKNDECCAIVQEIVNTRLQLANAKGPESEGRTLTKDAGDQLLVSTKNPTGAATTISEAERYRLNETVIRQSEHLISFMDAQFPKILRRLKVEVDKLPAILTYTKSEAGAEDGERFIGLVKTLQEVLPTLVKMYGKELKAKRNSLEDLAAFNTYEGLLAVVCSWTQEPFVDCSLKSQFHACVIEFE
ncbi:hypothetical protein L596_019057 [Steinernema carpocapsae]|uniref:Uncharacterized protein n=1 Tax=Steinernema carpocapsae TaxID=34508 RepID=A0A4U5N7D5_STECR|nr:hypothetical protein L596_019057 [Steinernema carpocapsae]